MQKTFAEKFTVCGGECDMFSRMRLDAIFMSMQEGGERHAKMLRLGHDAMLSKGLFFVLSRTHLQIHRMPRCGEAVIHTTWPGVSNRFFCPRFHTFTLEDGTPLLSAGALWVILDSENRKIVSPLKADLCFPDNSDIVPPVSLPSRVPKPGSDPTITSRAPVFSEFDINGHVNNTRYTAWICDALGADTLGGAFVSDLIVSYEKEIRTDEPLSIQLSRTGSAFTFQVLSHDGISHFFAAGELCREGEIHE